MRHIQKIMKDIELYFTKKISLQYYEKHLCKTVTLWETITMNVKITQESLNEISNKRQQIEKQKVSWK